MQKLQSNLRFLNDNQVKETNLAVQLDRLPFILHSTAITPSGTLIELQPNSVQWGLIGRIRQKNIFTFKCTCRHLRDLQGYCAYTSGAGFLFSFSPRQCVAPIALMDKPPLVCNIFIPSVVINTFSSFFQLHGTIANSAYNLFFLQFWG